MTQHSSFQMVRRHVQIRDEAPERRLAHVLDTVGTLLDTILDPNAATTTASPSPATTSSPTTTKQHSSSPSSSGSGGGDHSGGNNDLPASPSPVSSQTPGSGSSSQSNGNADSSPANANPSPANSPSADAGNSGNSNYAASQGIQETAPTPATTISGGQATTTASAPASTTVISTAADGSVATAVLPIGTVPSANPFSSVVVADSTTSNGAMAPGATIITVPGTTNTNPDGQLNSHHSDSSRIAIPIGVVAGIIALGLVIWFLVRRERKSIMEKDVNKALKISKSKQNNIATMTAGTFGFTAAGVFRRGRRGSNYNQSSNGHGNTGGDHRSWLAGRPMSEEGLYSDVFDNGQQQNVYYEDNQRASYNSFDHQGQHQTVEMSNAELSVTQGPVSGYYGANTTNQGPMDEDSSQGHHSQSFISGEGYATATEENEHESAINPFGDGVGTDPFGSGVGTFSHQNQSRFDDINLSNNNNHGHFDGSASYGYSNSATRGLDAAAIQGATGGQMLSPYPQIQRNTQRNSITNTTEWPGDQAYGGADIDEKFTPVTVESQAKYVAKHEGNGVMMRPTLNSSRWSG